MNKQRINTFISVISFICFSIVVFGILTLGFFVAPVIFKTVIPRDLASEIMTDIFLRYYPFAFTCTLITILAELLKILLNKELLKSRMWMLQISLIIAVTFLTGYSNFELLPKINEMRLTHKGPTLWTNMDFVLLHKQAEAFGKAMFMFGVIYFSLLLSNKSPKGAPVSKTPGNTGSLILSTEFNSGVNPGPKEFGENPM